jgi:cytochrome c oxidase subunit III
MNAISTPLSGAAVASEWRLPSPRKVGMLCLIGMETALFTIFVVAYLFYIGKSLNGPYPAEVLHFPWVGTFCLISSSFTVVAAERALGRRDHSSFRLWWGLTILLGAIFLAGTAGEWYDLIYRDGLTISTNLFGTTFYALVGLHASHVIVGLTLLSLVLAFSLLGWVGDDQHERLEMISWYWHFVDAIWVVVVTVVYVIGV